MKTLYLECSMGAAGDMLLSALLELHPAPEDFIRRMNALNIPNVTISASSAAKCGILGTHTTVTVGGIEEGSPEEAALPVQEHHHHEHHAEHEHSHSHAHNHTGLHDIAHIVSHLAIPETVRKQVLAVYQLIAEAESHAHGRPVTEIHFHEVGMMDAVADITGVCLLLHELAPEQILASPVHVGCGTVHCAHGILPVPAPATAFLLQGVPTYGGSIQGELCTPTGAALLKYFVSRFGAMPVMTVNKIGYGMGGKDFPTANCVRAFWGEIADAAEDEVLELNCNLDDMTPEDIAYASAALLDAGALDVFTTAVQMKKNRPGVLLTCLCRPNQRDELTRQLFQLTTTIGVRETLCRRSVLQRTEYTVNTEYGSIRMKESSGFGVKRRKPEHDDLVHAAQAAQTTVAAVRSAALHAKKD